MVAWKFSSISAEPKTDPPVLIAQRGESHSELSLCSASAVRCPPRSQIPSRKTAATRPVSSAFSPLRFFSPTYPQRHKSAVPEDSDTAGEAGASGAGGGVMKVALGCCSLAIAAGRPHREDAETHPHWKPGDGYENGHHLKLLELPGLWESQANRTLLADILRTLICFKIRSAKGWEYSPGNLVSLEGEASKSSHWCHD